ncbi:MAG: response regulator transcription factor [Candidatus Competibacteraceae bacterium]|jgi:DNA-binding NarL/FixJ family response regulator|nr:response regulator transcription factor [Candidatus Competibacteraceae bacterium]
MLTANSSDRSIVLLVDDAPDSLGMLTDALEEADYTVLVAIDGERALELVERVKPDVVLLDAIMPGLDGFETSVRLKQNPAMADVPIIFMTGLSDTEHIVKGLEAGGIDYITKPVNPQELLARLEVHLTNARLHHRAKAALDVAGRLLLSVDNTGTICWSMPQADHLLGFDSPTAESSNSGTKPQAQLPSSAIVWLSDLVNSDVLDDNQHQTFQADTRSIQLTYLGRISENEHLLRISEATKPPLEEVLRQSFALTEREAEVLALVADGKPNKKIASILQMSPRTVNTHLDRVFTKLGVDNRTAAAVVVMQKMIAATGNDE